MIETLTNLSGYRLFVLRIPIEYDDENAPKFFYIIVAVILVLSPNKCPYPLLKVGLRVWISSYFIGFYPYKGDMIFCVAPIEYQTLKRKVEITLMADVSVTMWYPKSILMPRLS